MGGSRGKFIGTCEVYHVGGVVGNGAEDVFRLWAVGLNSNNIAPTHHRNVGPRSRIFDSEWSIGIRRVSCDTCSSVSCNVAVEKAGLHTISKPQRHIGDEIIYLSGGNFDRSGGAGDGYVSRCCVRFQEGCDFALVVTK